VARGADEVAIESVHEVVQLRVPLRPVPLSSTAGWAGVGLVRNERGGQFCFECNVTILNARLVAESSVGGGGGGGAAGGDRFSSAATVRDGSGGGGGSVGGGGGGGVRGGGRGRRDEEDDKDAAALWLHQQLPDVLHSQPLHSDWPGTDDVSGVGAALFGDDGGGYNGGWPPPPNVFAGSGSRGGKMVISDSHQGVPTTRAGSLWLPTSSSTTSVHKDSGRRAEERRGGWLQQQHDGGGCNDDSDDDDNNNDDGDDDDDNDGDNDGNDRSSRRGGDDERGRHRERRHRRDRVVGAKAAMETTTATTTLVTPAPAARHGNNRKSGPDGSGGGGGFIDPDVVKLLPDLPTDDVQWEDFAWGLALRSAAVHAVLSYLLFALLLLALSIDPAALLRRLLDLAAGHAQAAVRYVASAGGGDGASDVPVAGDVC
jgi:hypothetical protein